jgi:hypothetical protein
LNIFHIDESRETLQKIIAFRKFLQINLIVVLFEVERLAALGPHTRLIEGVAMEVNNFHNESTLGVHKLPPHYNLYDERRLASFDKIQLVGGNVFCDDDDVMCS